MRKLARELIALPQALAIALAFTGLVFAPAAYADGTAYAGQNCTGHSFTYSGDTPASIRAYSYRKEGSGECIDNCGNLWEQYATCLEWSGYFGAAATVSGAAALFFPALAGIPLVLGAISIGVGAACTEPECRA